jgi:hypothetical protein
MPTTDKLTDRELDVQVAEKIMGNYSFNSRREVGHIDREQSR